LDHSSIKVDQENRIVEVLYKNPESHRHCCCTIVVHQSTAEVFPAGGWAGPFSTASSPCTRSRVEPCQHVSGCIARRNSRRCGQPA
jgi:hypothetical protein